MEKKKHFGISHLQLHLDLSHMENALKCGESELPPPLQYETDMCKLLYWKKKKKRKAFIEKKLPILSFKIVSFENNL